MVMSVSVNALASLHIHHEENASYSHSSDHSEVIPDHNHAPTPADSGCEDSCFIHCGMWHIVADTQTNRVSLSVPVSSLKRAWFASIADESRYYQRLWRPPAHA